MRVTVKPDVLLEGPSQVSPLPNLGESGLMGCLPGLKPTFQRGT